MYFYLQSLELLSGKAFNSMSDILHFDVRNVSFIILAYIRHSAALHISLCIFIFIRTYASTLYIAYCRYEILHTIISFFSDRYYF
jgi:hypothetical protein